MIAKHHVPGTVSPRREFHKHFRTQGRGLGAFEKGKKLRDTLAALASAYTIAKDCDEWWKCRRAHCWPFASEFGFIVSSWLAQSLVQLAQKALIIPNFGVLLDVLLFFVPTHSTL